jgi:NAD+ synthase (glutamine-hydrolysing)
MYGVNGSIPKTLVRYLLHWVAAQTDDQQSKNTLLDIIDTPVSPELLPISSEGKISQITEDIVGPYELHDFFLFYLLRYGFKPSKILYLATQLWESVHRLYSPMA